jgi:hypothetical protein
VAGTLSGSVDDPSLPEWMRYQSPVRTQSFVSHSIDWDQVHATTRLEPTVTTFGWRSKIVLTAPPYLVIGFWAYAGAFNNGLIAMAFGLPMLTAAAWWTRQVWIAGPKNSDRRHP